MSFRPDLNQVLIPKPKISNAIATKKKKFLHEYVSDLYPLLCTSRQRLYLDHESRFSEAQKAPSSKGWGFDNMPAIT